MRKLKFENDKYYHVYNRGAGKQEIFFNASDYFRFIESVFEFNSIDPTISLQLKRKIRNSEKTNRAILVRNRVPNQELCEVVCYNILPNHYHFILKQLVDNGISSFMKRISGGYSNYTKHKYDFSGAMYQGRFKAIEIDNENYLYYLISYILKNAEIHKISFKKAGLKSKKLSEWPWTNIKDLQDKDSVLYSTIKKEFKTLNLYVKYLNKVLKSSAKIKEEKKIYTLE